MLSQYTLICAGHGRKGTLRQRLRNAKSYQVRYCQHLSLSLNILSEVPIQDWKDAALVLDEFLRFDDWKKLDDDPYYDWKLVRKVRIGCGHWCGTAFTFGA